MYNLLAIGDIKLDTFIVIPEKQNNFKLNKTENKLCIEYGKKNPVTDITLQIAGSAPNLAIALTKMKKTTAVYSEMGADIIHEMALDFLQKHNVQNKFVKGIKNHDSAFAAVLNYHGESTQLVKHNGGNYRLPKRLPKIDWVHVSELGEGYQKLYLDLIKLSNDKHVKISFNPGVIQIQERKKAFFHLLKHTSVLFVNKVEAEQILEIKEKAPITSIVSGLKKLGPAYVVVTDGQNGAYAFDGEQIDFAPMFPGKRVEATGAGDAFASGFLGAIMYSQNHAEALRWGSVNAASVVQQIGPTKGLLSHAQIKKRLRENPRYKTKEI